VRLGYTSVKQSSAPTDPVAKGVFAPAPEPTISGHPWQRSTLKAVVGAWGPKKPKFTYTWTRIPVTGTPITVSHAPTYKLKASDVGSTFQLTVKASRVGFETVQKSSAFTTEVLPLLTQSVKPKVTGDFIVGGQVRAEGSEFDPSIDLTYYKNQWIRVKNGKESVMTNMSPGGLFLVSKDWCTRIFFRETVEATGYARTVFETKHKLVLGAYPHC
jgi:hypothetical protein